MVTKKLILPDEKPFVLDRYNCDIESPNQHRNVTAMNRRFSDEVIVVVKSETDESTVTYLRIKFLESDGKKNRWR